MKFLTLFICLIFSQEVIASKVTCGVGGDSGGSKMTWREIMACETLFADFPEIDVKGLKVKYNQLCLEGEKIRTINKVPVGNTQGRTIYVKGQMMDYISIDRIQTVEECSREIDGVCEEYTNVEYAIPLATEISVYIFGDENQLEYYFSKEFELEDCQE